MAGERAIIERLAPSSLISLEKGPAPKDINRKNKTELTEKIISATLRTLFTSLYLPKAMFSETILEIATGKPVTAREKIILNMV